MDATDLGNLAYLVLLGAVVGSYFFVSNRQSLGKTAQQAAIWGLIFLGMIAVYGLWSDISRTTSPRQAVFADQCRVEVPQSQDGHFYLTLAVNGQPVRFVVDTGATEIVLSQADAARVGLNPSDLQYFGRALTANGTVQTAAVRLGEMSLGEITDQNVPATVSGGEMPGSLLGMRYLNLWNRVSFGDGEMVLER